MQRISSKDLPFMLSFHTSAREFLKSSIIMRLKDVDDRTLVLNYADYILCCGSIDMYSCCLDNHPPQDFIEASYFIENILHDNFSESYYKYFLKTLKIFGIEVAALVGYLRFLERELPPSDNKFRVIPTLPVALIDSLKRHKLIDPVSYTVTQEPTAKDWLEVIGWVTCNYSFTGEIDWFSYIGQDICSSDTYAAYIFNLLKVLSGQVFDRFLLFEENINEKNM